MNLVFLQTHKGDNKIGLLSSLGINAWYLRKYTKRYKTNSKDIVLLIEDIIKMIKQNNNDVYFDICESKFFKKETLFKGIWIYKSNVIPHRLCDIMTCDEKKNALIERLNLMILILNDESTTSL